MNKVNRRQVGKSILGSVLAGAIPLTRASAEVTGQSHVSVQQESVLLKWDSVFPGIWRATLGKPEQHTPVKDRLIPPLDAALQNLPAAPSRKLPQVIGRIDRRGAHLQLPLEADELMYGFGLQLMSVQQRSMKRTIRVNADSKGDSGDSHAPVPFYVTTGGYGILVDTFRHAQFYCGEAHAKPPKTSSTRRMDHNTPQRMQEGDQQEISKVLVEVPRAEGADVYYFSGPSMLAAIQRYNLFSGGGIAPPEWGLGFWYRPELHMNEEAVLKLGQEFRERRIPCDVLGLEPGWQTHTYSCSFVWEPTRFPDPKRFLNAARTLGYRVNLWEHAFTHPSSPIFSALQPYAGDYAVWQGLVPDFAGESARHIFGDYHGSSLIDAGVSGFKLDECDNSDFTGGWSWPDESQFPSGFDGEQMHAAFGLRYQHAILSAFRQRKQPTYGLVRSSGALAAPYPFALYSDLYDHRQFVRGLINAGFSGLLWCPEVRDAVNEEDLLRRLQTAVFSPLAMVNAWYIQNPPWKQTDRDRNNRNEFTQGWEHLETRCREIIEWRMALLPYLRSAFAEYESHGIPAFRSPLLDFPDLVTLQKIDDQYMVGDRLLVAPLFAGENGRDVVLPSGNWHDFWTGKLMNGDQKIHVDRSQREIPVYIRENAVMPWAEPAASTEDPRARRVRVRIYGNGSLAWRGQGEDLQGMLLSVDANTSVTEVANAPRPYTIIGWDRIG
jgi:alpha-D-xyloside xylohydrolase